MWLRGFQSETENTVVVQRKLQLIEGVRKNQDALKVYRERIAEWCSNVRQ